MQANNIHSTSELAARLGLSRWTVSRALNRHPEVSEETAARVWAEAKRQGFAPSILGRGLRRGRTDLVGVIVPDLEDYYLTHKVSVLRDRIEEAGFHGIFQITDSTPASERTALERFAAMRCSGVVDVASRLEANDAALEGLASAGVPVVLIDPFAGTGQFVVTTDRAYALRESVKHLARLGHRRFAIFGINPETPYGRQRLTGLRAGCRTHGLDFEKAVEFYLAGEGLSDFEIGAQLAKELLSRPSPRATGIISLNDQIALGAMRALAKQGLSVPEDMSLIGYDDSDFSAHTLPPLTTVSSQATLLIHKAMDFLLGDSSMPRRIVVKPKLLVRESTARPSRKVNRHPLLTHHKVKQ